MNLKEHYNNLYQNAFQTILSDTYQVDNLIDFGDDKRFGITLLCRPDEGTKERIQEFLNKIKLIEPNQYFYPESDLHVTILSIISCYDGFDLSQIEIQKYIELIQKSINKLEPFDIIFRGITASPSCLMVQGFLSDNTLEVMRSNLRNNFNNSDLEQSMDKRYKIETVHSTVLRLKKKLLHKAEFLNLIEEYRNYDFGTFSINSLELVYNDWYQRAKNIKILHKFELNKN